MFLLVIRRKTQRQTYFKGKKETGIFPAAFEVLLNIYFLPGVNVLPSRQAQDEPLKLCELGMVVHLGDEVRRIKFSATMGMGGQPGLCYERPFPTPNHQKKPKKTTTKKKPREKLHLFILCVRNMYAVCVPGAQGGQEKASEPIELESQKVLSSSVVLGTEHSAPHC